VKKNKAAVLDFGSSKLTAIIGERGVNNTFVIRGSGEAEYAGFSNGEFFESDKLFDAVKLAIENAEINSDSKITEIYVGVPSDFSLSICKNATQTYMKRIKITKQDVNRLFDIADEFGKVPTHKVISRSPIYFVLDDNRKVLEPENEYTSKLSASLCFILAERKFTDLVDNIFDRLNIKIKEYLSEPLSEALYLLDEDVRNKYAVLIDCGHITTSVSIVKGDGLLLLNEFSVGGGHITGDLMKCLKISYTAADSLKRKIVLSIEPKQDDYYEIKDKNGVVPIEAKTSNEIVSARIESIGQTILKCLKNSGYEIPDSTPYFLTGGGLSYIKGAKDLLGKILGKNIELVMPSMPQLEKPHYSSVLGLLNLALKELEEENVNFFTKLFR
jgi:cell division protein FtsA